VTLQRTLQVVGRPTLALGIVLLVSYPTLSEQFSQIPDPRPEGWFVDTTGQIREKTVAELNRLAESVNRQTGGELAVVVIQTTDGAEHRRFATDLFNHWELGSSDRNDGLLILVALRDRKAEIILGDGIDDPKQVEASERIMNTVMVPRFRDGEPERAVLQGAFACATDILGINVENPAQLAGAASPSPVIRRESGQPAESQRSERTVHERSPAPSSPISPWLFWGGGLLGSGGLGIGLRRYLRYRKRLCPSCRVPMVLLPETADDRHLQKSERLEERLGSVDYDVWSCPSCDRVQKLRYGAIFTRYSRCPHCGAKTKNETTQTLESATEYREGRKQITEDCKNCDYHRVYYRTIPRITKSSDSSSSRSFSSSSRSSSSSRGGGRSSGRGASGSW